MLRALRSVRAQTLPVQEIIVIDDGSSDGSEDAVKAEFGSLVHYVHQSNAGVSVARNRGLEMAQGQFLALLDSDDEWLPDKTRQQVEWLQQRPTFGLVLCDVVRVDLEGRELDTRRRRDCLPQDGMILADVLRNPEFIPVSAMFRREVLANVGGFDESLRTAEDLDFHLRVASQWPIGVIEASLARATFGLDGLSRLPCSSDDYLLVIERAVHAARARLPADLCDSALAGAYLKNTRHLIYDRRWRDALRIGRQCWRSGSSRRTDLLGLLPMASRHALASLLGRS